MPSKISDQQPWTIRFKQHKTTVILLVSQSQSFRSIKLDLLDAIKATGIDNVNGYELPADADDVIFGVPVDQYDFSQGWVGLELPEVITDDEAKGKSNGVRKETSLIDNLLGAGLKDGAVVAFKFRDDGPEDDDDWDVLIPCYEDEDSSQEQP